MRSPSSEDLAQFLGSRVVRVQALQRCGLPRSTIAHRCRAGGPWQTPLPGIVLLHSGPLRRPELRRAALLYCGRRDEPCLLTGLDALELHGVKRLPAPSGPVHCLVPPHVQRSGHGRVLVERTDRLPDERPGRWPLAPVPRAALDFARRCRDRGQVRSVLAEAVQRGYCTPTELTTELDAGSTRGSALPRAVLDEVVAGVRSPAEAQARELVLASGLPAPLWNPSLYGPAGRFVATPDAWFDDVGMAWEIDSLEWHLAPADYAATLDRRNRLMSAGVLVVHHLPSALRRDPARVLADLRANHAQAALRPRPALHAVAARA